MISELEKIKLYTGNYTIEELINIIKKGLVFNSYLYNSPKIINDIATLETNKYRSVLNYLEKNNLEFASKIEKARKKYVINQIELINKEGIFNYLYDKNMIDIENKLPKEMIDRIELNLKYNDYDGINRILKNYTEKCLLEFIIDLYFKDIAYNFISNLKTMMRYLNNINENIIPIERLELYKKVLNFYNLNIEEQKELYYSYNSNINYSLDFYDDFQNCKKHSYNKINENIINKEQLSKYYNSKLSKEKGVNIYELNGEDFYLYAHVCKLENKYIFPFEENSDKTISLSLIGKNNTGTYKTIFESITFGFENIDTNNIIHLFNSDSYTHSYGGSKKIQKIYTPKDFLLETYGYNEILYSQKNNCSIYPSYIICFNEIRDIDLYFSKLKNLPVIMINTLNYRKNHSMEDMLESNYKSAEEASNISSYRMM